jgi:hypothetical protein
MNSLFCCKKGQSVIMTYRWWGTLLIPHFLLGVFRGKNKNKEGMCFCCWNTIIWCPKDNYCMVYHYEKKRCFTTSFAIQFLNYKRHL